MITSIYSNRVTATLMHNKHVTQITNDISSKHLVKAHIKPERI